MPFVTYANVADEAIQLLFRRKEGAAKVIGARVLFKAGPWHHTLSHPPPQKLTPTTTNLAHTHTHTHTHTQTQGTPCHPASAYQAGVLQQLQAVEGVWREALGFRSPNRFLGQEDAREEIHCTLPCSHHETATGAPRR